MNTITSSIIFFLAIISVIVFFIFMYLHVKNKQAIKRKQQEAFDKKVREDTLKKYKTDRALSSPSQKHRPNYRRYAEDGSIIDSGPDIMDVIIAAEVIDAITTPSVEPTHSHVSTRFVEEVSLVQEDSCSSCSCED